MVSAVNAGPPKEGVACWYKRSDQFKIVSSLQNLAGHRSTAIR